MSRIKLSFSLLLTIFLVGILSTAVFASNAYGFKVTADGSGGFNASFKRIASTETNFTVSMYTKDASNQYTVLGKDYPVTVADDNTVTVNIPKADGITVGTLYKLVLKNDSGEVTMKFAVLTDSKNVKLLSDPNPALDTNGSGLANSNHTGADSVKKPSQKTHGFYQNNTNSCAGCHQTHTAADGEYLLFKDGVYSTCSACHDGTTGAYNSFAPATATTPNSVAGTFDVTASGHNGSLHQADGSLQVSAAPGGNNDVAGSNNAVATATYGGEFDCSSCHAPHGSGSLNENNLNSNPLGWGGIAYATTNNDTKNGKLFKGLTINTTVPTTFSTPYIVVKKTLVAGDISTDKTKSGYLYNRVGLAADDKVLQTYRWDGQKYVADYSLWLRDTGHVGAPFENANTFFKAAITDVTNSLTVVWRDAFAYAKAGTPAEAVIDSVDSAQISMGIDVETTNDIASLFDSKNANYVYDSGTEMSKYCSACHIDYLSTTRGNDTGVYTQAHRHATAQDRLSCVRCHFGHGSEAKIMKDANDKTYFDKTTTDGMTDAQAISYLVDPNPSSALKRYTGMSVCYACHGQGDQFRGNLNNVDRPNLGDPGAVRTPAN